MPLSEDKGPRDDRAMTKTIQQADFADWRRDRVTHLEWAAGESLPQPGREPKRLIGAMRYATMSGGKRIRALLCYAAGQVTGAEDPILDRAAVALEMIHAYSLVHDDMPCMDNDTLRRGKPTVHVQYGEALAMLAGDALQTEAFYCL
ncbi:geranyltranstransferase, partial [gut metagenome]